LLRAQRGALRSSCVAHIRLSACVGSELGSPAVVAQPFAGRRSLAGLLRASSPYAFLDPKLWSLVAGRAGRDGSAPCGNAVHASRTVAPAAHHDGGRPVATDLPVAAPADARARDARSCRHTRLPQGRACQCAYVAVSRSAPATRLRRASIGKLTTGMPTRVCFPYEADCADFADSARCLPGTC